MDWFIVLFSQLWARLKSSSHLSSWCCWAAAPVAPPSRSPCHQWGHELRKPSSPPSSFPLPPPPQTWKTHSRSAGWDRVKLFCLFFFTSPSNNLFQPVIESPSHPSINHHSKAWNIWSNRLLCEQEVTSLINVQKHRQTWGASAPAALELRINAGESHEELVLQLQRRLSEDGGWSVVQRRRPAEVK